MNAHIIPAMVKHAGDCQTCYGSSDGWVYKVLFNNGICWNKEVRMCEKCLKDFSGLITHVISIKKEGS